MLLASLAFTCPALTCMFLTHLRATLLRDQFPGPRVLAYLFGATPGLFAVCFGATLDRDIGLCLAPMLLGLLARFFALLLLVVLVLLLFVRCYWLARERRCADAERQRGADHGGQDGTVDGVVDVHGDPRCCCEQAVLVRDALHAKST
jgi:hypothetical protein